MKWVVESLNGPAASVRRFESMRRGYPRNLDMTSVPALLHAMLAPLLPNTVVVRWEQAEQEEQPVGVLRFEGTKVVALVQYSCQGRVLTLGIPALPAGLAVVKRRLWSGLGPTAAALPAHRGRSGSAALESGNCVTNKPT